MSKPLKIIFAGTPEFASVALEALFSSSHEVLAVYTQPDRPSGRGLKVKPSPVKELAKNYQLSCHQPASLNDSAVQEKLADWKADVLVVSAYGLFLPGPILKLPRLGCVNIHPSLLPRWRGAAPIQRSIQAGDKVTGISIMQMDAGLDTGPILLQRQYVLDHEETSQTLHDALAKLGARTLIDALDQLSTGAVKAIPQSTEGVTYAHKITKEEALIDWMLSATELEHQIRAFNPWPVAYTTWRGQNLRVWFAKARHNDEQRAEPRTILKISAHGIDVATGDGVLRLSEMQLPGGKKLSASDFYNAYQHELKVGQHLV